jgi:hypothetical protein
MVNPSLGMKEKLRINLQLVILCFSDLYVNKILKRHRGPVTYFQRILIDQCTDNNKKASFLLLATLERQRTGANSPNFCHDKEEF